MILLFDYDFDNFVILCFGVKVGSFDNEQDDECFILKYFRNLYIWVGYGK